MIRATIKALVEQSVRHPAAVLAAALVLLVGGSAYTVRHFAINTDVNQLISHDLPWRQREVAMDAAFPQRYNVIAAVLDAPTSEMASKATGGLVAALGKRSDLFRSVSALREDPFFARNALLFPATEQVVATTSQLDQAEPLIQSLAADRSLRGLTDALSLGLLGVKRGDVSLDQLADVMTKASAAVEDVLAGRPASFSWRALMSGSPHPGDLRRYIEIHPVLDYSTLQPGKRATDVIRQTTADLKLSAQFGARVRLTGSVPVADEEFATVQEGAFLNIAGTVVVVLVILWLALRSPKIILSVFASVAVGLAITAALGLMMLGALNLISVAFAVLFVGIGVDFGIQFSVRYRAERHEVGDLRKALSNTAEYVSAPLTLAAVATAAGFLSFLPTDYRGVSELGQIAGVGMIIAYLTSITVLPALLVLFNPPGEREPLGYAALAPVDRFMERRRIPILIGTAIVVLGGLPLLYWLQFDFNPIHLRSPEVESIATYLDTRNDPETGASAVDVLAPSQSAASEVAQRVANIPEVSHVVTLDSFVPADQPNKLAAIRKVAEVLEPDLTGERRPAPSDAENVAALKASQQQLDRVAGDQTGRGAVAAKRLAAALAGLAAASADAREKAQAVFIEPLDVALDGLRLSLQPEPVTEQSLPPDINGRWISADGRARVQILPKGDPNDNETLRAFARAVLAVEPSATGGPISILESGRTVVRAFIEAGAFALLSITILLWFTLRKIQDVLLTLVPLLLAGVVTLELCVVLGLPLNFANIIALPLLLGIGVAFKIYFIMAWRSGETRLLESPLTRAVFFSALTAATAFGSLWLSNHPGTSSMGKLLALSLICTLAAAVLFQPVLMGPPRGVENP